MKASRGLKRNGFTLVELLVVIVIIAALAGLSFAVLPRIQRKAKGTASMANLRQFAPVLNGYAGDHSMKLPAILAQATLADGTEQEMSWIEICLQELNPDAKITQLRDKKWWETTKPFAQNPLFTSWTPTNPGYAMNAMIAENVENARQGGGAMDPLAVSVPLAAIDEPVRTPLVAPGVVYQYRYDTLGDVNRFNTSPAKDLLVEDKLSILFVDGHVESMTPKEYVNRQFFIYPDKTEN